jgi:hypothetical protein
MASGGLGRWRRLRADHTSPQYRGLVREGPTLLEQIPILFHSVFTAISITFPPTSSRPCRLLFPPSIFASASFFSVSSFLFFGSFCGASLYLSAIHYTTLAGLSALFTFGCGAVISDLCLLLRHGFCQFAGTATRGEAHSSGGRCRHHIDAVTAPTTLSEDPHSAFLDRQYN